MKILILGGDGFIGSYLRKKHVSVGDEVVILDKCCIRSNVNSDKYQVLHFYIEKDNFQTFEILLDSGNFDFVYNCIAIATPHYYVLNPIDTFQLDFQINYNIIQKLVLRRIPFMHFSTSEVYGKVWNEPYNEDTTNLILGPVNKIRWIYATSKILLDQLIYSHKANCCIVRPFNFIGHDMDWLPDIDTNTDNTWRPRLPACFLNNLLSKKTLNVVLPGTQKRCYTFIDDAIEALYAIFQNWNSCRGEIINIGNPENEVKILDVAYMMIDFYEELTKLQCPGIIMVDGEDFYGKGYDDSERRLPDISKITTLTPWKPQYNLSQTFQTTVFDAVNAFAPK